MKKIIGLSLILIFVFSSQVLSQPQVGLLKSVTGGVSIQRNETIILAATGGQLENQDTLITGYNSTAGIIFTDGTTFTVGPNTEFEMRNYLFEPETDMYDFSLYLKKGSAVYNSGKIGKLAPDAVNLSTPRATIGVRGTRLIIKVE